MSSFISSELFAQFVYSPSLSYDVLHNKEEELIAFLEQLLTRSCANHIHYQPMGDMLLVECRLPAHTEDLCHSFCSALAEFIEQSIKARMLFVRKDLGAMHIYKVAAGTWHEAVLQPPALD